MQALFFGGAEKLPAILMRREVPGLDIVVDPCAGFIGILVTILLCAGIKQVNPFCPYHDASCSRIW